MPFASDFRFLQWRIGNQPLSTVDTDLLPDRLLPQKCRFPFLSLFFENGQFVIVCPLDIIFLRKNKVCYTIIEYICTIINDTSTFQKNQMPTE